MTTIPNLNSVDTVNGSDLIPIYSQQNGNARKFSLANLAAFVLSSLSTEINEITQYASSNFIQFNDGANDITAYITPANAAALYTLLPPSLLKTVDRQKIKVVCLINSIATLSKSTLSGTINYSGLPTSMAVNDYFTMQFDIVTKTWYRVG